jgi:hypothetical protein
LKEGIYIYCIIATEEPLSFGPMGIGGNGEPVYTIGSGSLGAVVSKTPVKKYSVARENVIAHERVIEEVMKNHAVLPVRFATIAGDEEIIMKILEKEHDSFVDLLRFIVGKKELGLKALFSDQEIYRDILEQYEDIKALKEQISGIPPEKTHYQRMEIGKMVEAALSREKEKFKEEFLQALSPLSVETKTNHTYGEHMIMNAAFLVEDEKEEEFDRMLQGLSDKYDSKVRFKYVGLLPPFNFINLVIRTDEY